MLVQLRTLATLPKKKKPRFNSKHTHGISQISVSSISGAPVLLRILHAHGKQTFMQGKHTYTYFFFNKRGERVCP